MLGVVIATAERSRLYYRFGSSPCFPVAAAPDRSVHRAYGLPAFVRTPEIMAQSAGYNLIDRQGVMRWASAGELLHELPRPESLLALV
jgi:hypothetical protein